MSTEDDTCAQLRIYFASFLIYMVVGIRIYHWLKQEILLVDILHKELLNI